MPYTLFQGGRRRRRGPPRWVWALTLAAALAVIVAVLTGDLGSGGERPAAARRTVAAVPAPLTGLTRPPAGGGTAPATLGVRLDESRDAVALRFKRPPRSGLLFDLDTGRVLWRKDPTRTLPIASLTKMMTALVVDERVSRGERVRITRQALAYRGSGVGVLPLNRRVSVNALLHGLLLPSGNDAAIALAQHAGLTVRRFVGLMNASASRMRLGCTRFSSPDGYRDRGNHSCAADLAAIARALLRRPRLARIVRRRQAALPFPIKGGRLYLYNNNPLLRQGYRGTTGLKTGYTDKAGRCLVATARRGPIRLGVVLLHSADPGKQAMQLLDRGFRSARS